MNINNPYKRKKPRNDITFKSRVWFAGEDGTCEDPHGKTMIIGPEYIWFTPEFSIPLDYIREIGHAGKGFYIIYHDLNQESDSIIYLCVRSIAGYNPKKTALILTKLEESYNYSASIGFTPITPLCEECGSTRVERYEFTRSLGFMGYFRFQSEGFVLCPRHALTVFKSLSIRNYLLSGLSLAILAGCGNLRNAKVLFSRGLIDKKKFVKYKILMRLPILLPIIFIAAIAITSQLSA